VRFRIPDKGTLKKWVKIYDQEGAEGLSKENRGRQKFMPRKPKKPMTREEQLLDELADLKAENAYLKKLHALVQSEKEKEEKRKSSRN
jgi:transposase